MTPATSVPCCLVEIVRHRVGRRGIVARVVIEIGCVAAGEVEMRVVDAFVDDADQHTLAGGKGPGAFEIGGSKSAPTEGSNTGSTSAANSTAGRERHWRDGQAVAIVI